ncbi:MAG: hypothetical protein CEE42_09845 [Promethearchaeota archaeon Loki_b31]|nr:MAG: hypothetical protein CEE42_09845 [Candidatus Lokiarchaeota archaeon Loki_b31]
MRIRTRKNLFKKNIAITFLFLIPVISFSIFLGFGLYILNDLASLTLNLDPPNTDYFTPLNQIEGNQTYLKQMADTYNYQLEKWHVPTNISIDVTFTNDNYSEVGNWHGTDNGNLHLGYTLASQCLRYKYALDNIDLPGMSDELNNATRMIKKCVSGFTNMLAAPNGGIGPDYPGMPARFVSAPENRKYHEWLFDDHPRHFNGTGPYKNWRVRVHTSRDELAGYYLGFASVLKFVDPEANDDSRWCVERIGLLAAQMIEGFRKTNWLLLGGDGEPVGSDLNPILGENMWQLTLLRIGATAFPEKYDSLYNYVAAKIMSMNNGHMGSVSNTAMDTYALAFSMDVEFALIMLEDNPLLQYHYIKRFEEGFYSFLRYHRNAFFNIIHLAFMTLVQDSSVFEDPQYNDETIKWDILDQLWRFNTSGWGNGIRNYNLTMRPNSTRATSLNPDIAAMEISPLNAKWLDFFENNVYGTLFSWMGELIDIDNVRYLFPLTISEMGVHHFLWEHGKFFGTGGNPSGNGLTQVIPNSYLVIYWMGKAFDIF